MKTFESHKQILRQIQPVGVTGRVSAVRGLTVSVSTVNFHVHNVLDKLGAKTRTEAVVIAAREGLIDV